MLCLLLLVVRAEFVSTEEGRAHSEQRRDAVGLVVAAEHGGVRGGEEEVDPVLLQRGLVAAADWRRRLRFLAAQQKGQGLTPCGRGG